MNLGPTFAETWQRNPERMCFASTRYKFVKRLLAGLHSVAEIGAADGYLSEIVRSGVGQLDLFDLDPPVPLVQRHDIVAAPLPEKYDAIYMIDVLEHILPIDETAALLNIRRSLMPHGIFIAGVPSLESQQYANPWSLVGHVNCKSANDLRATMQQHFRNVFLFTMNDEQIGTGNGNLAFYFFVLCCSPRAAA